MKQASRKPNNQDEEQAAAPVSAVRRCIAAYPVQMRAKTAQTPFRGAFALPTR